jgi:hypothetical protein
MIEITGTPHHDIREGFSIDASEAGLAPGQWPDAVEYEGVTFNLVTKHWDRDGDLTHVTYHSGVAAMQIEND